MRVAANGDVYEMGCDLIDVTSARRPDPRWRFTDAAGHEHRWYADGLPAVQYHCEARYTVPSVSWVVDERGVDEDGEEYETGHYACVQCGAPVTPANTADASTVYARGLRWCRINGVSVPIEEFAARAKAAGVWP